MSPTTLKTGILSKMTTADRHRLIGEIAVLMLGSKLHRKYYINDIGSVILPAIDYDQFRIYKVGDEPVGLLTWALLSDEIEEKLEKENYILKYEDWNSGDNAWIIDFVAPFGHAKSILKDLKNTIFPDRIAKSLRIDKDGKYRGIKNWHGRDVAKSFGA